MKALDLRNKRFERLVVVKKSHRKNNKVMWECLCDCGNTTFVSTYYLTSGKIRSCGCLHKEQLIARSTSHNQRGTHLYSVWRSLRQRCNNPNSIQYKDYGGRGITVCDEWNAHFEPFYDWAMANGYDEGLTIDRIDNNKGYSPDNCRWANRTTQCNNTRSNHRITYKGATHTLSEWTRITGLSYVCLRQRINNLHWSVKKALTTPNTHLSYKPRNQK